MNQLRYAIRVLAKARGFTFVAVLTLALGIGVNSAIFTIVNAVILRPLPYPDSARILSLWEIAAADGPENRSSKSGLIGAGNTSRRFTVAPASLADYRAGAPSLEAAAGLEFAGMNLTGSGAPERLLGEKVTADYFAVLRTQPAQGRTFLPEEDQPGNDREVILMDRFRRRRFGADPNIVGSSITLDAHSYRVIGIMPADFQPPSQFGSAAPLSFLVPAAYPAELLASRGDHEINVIARLKPSATLARAQAELDAVSARLAREYPSTNRNLKTQLKPLAEDIAGGVKTSVLVLAGAAGLILLIACVNLANLLMARAVGRGREISVRIALGASRWRVMRELLAQSAVLAGAGCAAGLLVGAWTRRVLIGFAPSNIPRLETAGLDGQVVAFTALLSVATGLLFGIFPAWQVSKARPAESLKSSERGAAGNAVMRWRSALMVAEIAVSMVLLTGAGLLLRSFMAMNGVDLGFTTERVLAMNINLPPARYQSAAQRFAFFDELATRVEGLPGVQRAGFGNRMPLRGGWSGSLELDLKPGEDVDADLQAVSPGYFETLGIALERGRAFTAADRSGAPAVAMVNRAFARAFLGDRNPVGHRLRRNQRSPWVEIAGVVSDVRRGGRTAEINPELYFPAGQTELYPVQLADFAFRAAGDPKALIAAVEREVWAIDKDQPVTNVKTLEEVLSTSAAPRRFQAMLLMAFAALAAGLALVGVYGVVSYSVSQRTGELGLRVALGASRRDILALVLFQAAARIAIGVAAGAGGAYALSRYLASLLFHVTPGDPATYATLAAALCAIALAACAGPALRASAVDPMVALRYE